MMLPFALVGFDMLNQSARDRVLTKSAGKNMGVLIMFAVRPASNPKCWLNLEVQELCFS